MHLHAFDHGQLCGLCRAGLGQRYGQRGVVGVFVQLAACVAHSRKRDFRFRPKMCGAMLKCLKAADFNAELFAFFQVAHRHRKGPGAEAQHLGRQRRLSGLKRRFQHGHGVIDRSQHIVARGLHVIKCHLRRVAGIDHILARAGDAIAVVRQVKQGQAGVCLGQNQQTVCIAAIHNEPLSAGQAKPVAVGACLKLRGIGVMFCPLVHGKPVDHVARRNRRQRIARAVCRHLSQRGGRDHGG